MLKSATDQSHPSTVSHDPYPPPIDPLQNIPEELTPEDYLLNSENLLDTDQPESIRNNYLLFSPLLPVLAFVILSMTVIGFYVNQREQQVADIRNQAATPPCATGSALTCTYPGTSCGEQMICVSGKHTENYNICDCIAVSNATPDIMPLPYKSPTVTPNAILLPIGIGTCILGIAGLLFVVLRKKKK